MWVKPARAIFNWLPVSERGRANGILFSGSRLGAALAFPLLEWMVDGWGWRSSFVWLGGIGVLWAVLWLLWFCDHPDRPASKTEGEAGAELRFGQVFHSRPMLLAMIQYFASNFTFVSANAFPFLIGLTGGSSAYFVAAALLNVAAVACWLAMRPPKLRASEAFAKEVSAEVV